MEEQITMNKIKKALVTTSFLVSVSMLCSISALAYIDPATTAMMTQIIAGVVITLGVTFGVFRRKIFMFFKNLSVKSTQKKILKEQENKDKQ